MDLGLQIWYTGYVGVQMGTAFWRLPFFIACDPDRTLSGLLSRHPKAQIFSHPELRPPKPTGDGCRWTGRSPEFSAMRLWHRLAAKPPGFRFPPESAALPQPCRCSAALIVLPCSIPPVCTARIPGGTFFHIAPMRFLNKNSAAYADKMRKARPKPKEAFTTRESCPSTKSAGASA